MFKEKAKDVRADRLVKKQKEVMESLAQVIFFL